MSRGLTGSGAPAATFSPEDPSVHQDPQATAGPAAQPGSLAILALVAFLAGAASGLVGAAFRLILDQANRFRGELVAWAHGESLLGFFLVISAAALSTASAAWLVHRQSPQAAGSGIPHVEAVLKGELPPAPFRLLPVKFLGGVLAIGAGLVLGRDGPTGQMGASVAHLVGKVCRRTWADCRVLMASGCGAGLATAFNAPIAGATFVLEELVRCFETRLAIAALGASAGAIAVARLFLGETPDFQVTPLPYPGFSTVYVHLALGVVAGFLGVAYNRALIGALTLAHRLSHWPVALRAGLIGAGVGLVAWFSPSLVGGGDNLTQQTLAGTGVFSAILLAFLLRFGLGAVSYAAGTPGGLFAPMLVLGAQIGVLFSDLGGIWLPEVGAHAMALAVVGMAAFFTAVVRTPLAAIILVIEVTASFTLLLPMLSACFTAMLVPTLLGDPPILDSLSLPPFLNKDT
jgi:chloride channel protein, CIC family